MRLFIGVVMVLSFAAGMNTYNALVAESELRAKRACNKAWRMSAARYKAFEKVPVAEIRADADKRCSNMWWLND